jgi:hypothetical protein
MYRLEAYIERLQYYIGKTAWPIEPKLEICPVLKNKISLLLYANTTAAARARAKVTSCGICG